jgi:hypothetical protein
MVTGIPILLAGLLPEPPIAPNKPPAIGIKNPDTLLNMSFILLILPPQ